MQKQNLKIAICDDQKSDSDSLIQYLKEYMQQIGMQAQFAVFQSAEKLLASQEDYPLIFLDIFMSGMNGMDAAKTMRHLGAQNQVVFVSSSVDFAAESYNVDALHYLVKPIERDNLFQVMDKFFSKYHTLRTISVKTGREEQTIFLSDFIYAEANGKKCTLHMKAETIQTRTTLSQLEQMLPQGEFVRPIRYALVSLAHVVRVPSDTLQLSNGSQIPISRGQREQVKQAFAEYKWNWLRKHTGGGVF